ncbi:DJ-1 family protein [Malaciobacter molluscorum LMG 25693]|uniref:DJ-1 family protein n=1 Tax=Malaciobacter molluscorum LMG 25693 TaxID=870501 RepID=A0A2G1DG90_9BACT|nr:DJ-1 family glyoxalase III [Malaciobacter molluscorum]AXX93630.1 DJ-1 family protein [Malaciobacter molluscorum LMG 25693]PHO17336.1 DJ-1 family protein [Malaciobacter molluscorum LMG 25693]RXJ92545.1 DJ-1 family protein [Malaciobacter molluscorum]
MSKVIIPISEGFEEIEAISIIDVLRRANIEVTIASLEELQTKGAHNIKIIADKKIEDINADEFDMIVLPGGLPNAFNLAENNKIQNLLKEFKNKNKYIGAICAAPYALHKADVLNNNFTCYPSFEEKIRLEGYHTDNIVVDDKVITSRGPATAMEFALEIVDILEGKNSYEKVTKELLL